MNSTNNILRTVSRIVNLVLNGIAAIVHVIAILVVFCGVLAPAFMSTMTGEKMISAVKESWQNIFWPAITADPTKTVNLIIINEVESLKPLFQALPTRFAEYFIIGIVLWIALVGLGRALGIRRFARIPFITEETLRGTFGPIFETPSRMGRQPNVQHTEHETNNFDDRVINFNRYSGQHVRSM